MGLTHRPIRVGIGQDEYPLSCQALGYGTRASGEIGSSETFARALSDAKVDLNPHQVAAAMFAVRSPIAAGAILADEVGLGKTIEASLLLAQKWAERKRRLLIIVPANLRKQWSVELMDKFHLKSVILESKDIRLQAQLGNFNPFRQDAIVIVSYNFAAKNAHYINPRDGGPGYWDMVVVDEAHRLRNVYKTNNKQAKAIKQAIEPFFKVLLTATPAAELPLGALRACQYHR